MPKIASLWPAWIAITLALTVKPFWWHLDYFRRRGPQFLWFYLAALAVLGATTFLYLRVRRPASEPRFFLLFFLAFFLVYAPLPTLYALWALFVAFSLGGLILRRAPAEGALEALTLWTAAGLGAMSASMFGLGLAGLYYRWVILSLLAAGALAGWRNLGRIQDIWKRLDQAYAASASSSLCGVCAVFVFVFSVASAMVALSPETAFDPVSFHFVYARNYALQHRLAAIPRLPYSYFPQNVEILYTLGFLIDGQAAAKILTYAFFPLAAMGLVLIGKRWFSSEGALVGAALFVTTPFLSWTGSVAKNDVALALYILLALYGVLRWIETKRFAWLATGVVFLAFAFGVKHVAVLGAVPIGLLIFWNLRHGPLGLRRAAVLAVIFIACGLFWHIRTWILAGNPLYPEFGASAVRSTTATGHPELSRLDRLGIYMSTPWLVLFRGQRAFESPSENPFGIALVAFLPLLFLRSGIRNRPAKLLLLFSIVYFLYWAAIVIWARFAIAALGVLYVYIGDRICAFYPQRRASVLALAAYSFVFALSLTAILEVNAPRLKLFARRIGPEQFLRDSLITYRSIEAVNRVARPGELVYSVGNCSTFYSKIEFHCYYDHRNIYSLHRIAEDLWRTHYTYLIVTNQWAEPQHLRVVEDAYHTELIYQDVSFRVYRLRRGYSSS